MDARIFCDANPENSEPLYGNTWHPGFVPASEAKGLEDLLPDGITIHPNLDFGLSKLGPVPCLRNVLYTTAHE